MNDAFEERKKANEEKWAHDEALHFKVAARRNRLLGLWAAAELGMSQADAEDYVKAVMAAQFHAAGGENVFHKLRADFAAAKISLSDHAIHRKMEELLALAADLIMHEPKH